jgi:hypothetical protein
MARAKRTRVVSEGGWHGKHLTEDEIVADMLAKITADPEVLKQWTDPQSWRGLGVFGLGMNVRNWYGLWREDCPLTKADGTWPPPPDPDDISGRIIDRVRKALAKGRQRERDAMHFGPFDEGELLVAPSYEALKALAAEGHRREAARRRRQHVARKRPPQKAR